MNISIILSDQLWSIVLLIHIAPQDHDDGGGFKFKRSSSKIRQPVQNLQNASPTPLPELVEESNCYIMTSQPRGYCVIINNREFEPSSGMHKYPRKGED